MLFDPFKLNELFLSEIKGSNTSCLESIFLYPTNQFKTDFIFRLNLPFDLLSLNSIVEKIKSN